MSARSVRAQISSAVAPSEKSLVFGNDQQSLSIDEKPLGDAGDHLLERRTAELVEIDLHLTRQRASTEASTKRSSSRTP